MKTIWQHLKQTLEKQSFNNEEVRFSFEFHGDGNWSNSFRMLYNVFLMFIV